MSILAVVVVLAVGLLIGYAAGRLHRQRHRPPETTPREAPAPSAALSPPVAVAPAPSAPVVEPHATASSEMADGAIPERARIIRSFEAETARLKRLLVAREAMLVNVPELAEDRRRLFAELAASRGETARYRQVVVDLENNAPPPFFGAGAPDDLKLIVGVGPVLERMLQQLGITTYRQIARWSERDIDDFDAKLPEFPGRIRRDAWVTQARALHASKYGAPPSARDR